MSVYPNEHAVAFEGEENDGYKLEGKSEPEASCTCHPRYAERILARQSGTGRRGRNSDRIVAFIEGARAVQLPIIFVRNTHSEWTTTKSRKEQTTHVGVDYRTRYWEGTPGNEFLEGLNPGPEDLIFIKHSYSPYAHGPMDLIFRSRGIQTVLLTGGSTLGAVETVAKDSMVRGYNVVVVDDYVHPRSGAIYEMVIDYVNRHLGITASSEEIMSCWRGNG